MDSIFYSHETPGCLLFTGPDRVDFLQRLSTNDVALLSPNRSVRTVLTDPAARILDVLQLFEIGDTIAAITVPGRGARTRDFLRRRIFFNDDVSVKDVSGEKAIFEIDGSDASDLLAIVGAQSPLDIDEVVSGEFLGEPVYVVGRRGLQGVGFRLMAGTGGKESLDQALSEAGGTAVTPQAYDLLRIEAGLPASPEMAEEYTPLETRLEDAISNSKGCYTGQEVIARQITYEKVTRQMVGLRLDGGAVHGGAILVDGKKAGNITSIVESPRFGHIALAVMKINKSEAGTRVSVEENGEKVEGEVVALPFTAE